MENTSSPNGLDRFLKTHEGKIPDIGRNFLQILEFSQEVREDSQRLLIWLILQAMVLISQKYGDSLLEYMLGKDHGEEISIESARIAKMPGAELASNKNVYLLEIRINGYTKLFTINFDKENHVGKEETPVSREAKVLRIHKGVIGQRIFGTMRLVVEGKEVSVKNYLEGVTLEMLMFDSEYTASEFGPEIVSKITSAVRKKIDDLISKTGGLPADMHFGNIIINVETNGEVNVGICDVESIETNLGYVQRVSDQIHAALEKLQKPPSSNLAFPAPFR